MRLDKYLSLCGKASRTETAKAVRGGEVLVNGTPARRADHTVDPDKDEVIFRGEPVAWRAFTYILLHKPDGVVSATEDRLHGEQTVLDLLPPDMNRLRPALFPCGRLDKHTTGLVLLTNNGLLAHRLLSPARHVDKTYAYTVKFPLSPEDITALESGVCISLKHTDRRDNDRGGDRDSDTTSADEAAALTAPMQDGYITAPCTIEAAPPTTPGEGSCTGRITLHEGKYHQIKRMMEARHNQITSLCRVSFGPLTLDASLSPGAWRLLTDDEICALEACGR